MDRPSYASIPSLRQLTSPQFTIPTSSQPIHSHTSFHDHYPASIFEITGESSTGKTQTCLSLIKETIKPQYLGGQGSSVILLTSPAITQTYLNALRQVTPISSLVQSSYTGALNLADFSFQDLLDHQLSKLSSLTLVKTQKCVDEYHALPKTFAEQRELKENPTNFDASAIYSAEPVHHSITNPSTRLRKKIDYRMKGSQPDGISSAKKSNGGKQVLIDLPTTDSVGDTTTTESTAVKLDSLNEVPTYITSNYPIPTATSTCTAMLSHFLSSQSLLSISNAFSPKSPHFNHHQRYTTFPGPLTPCYFTNLLLWEYSYPFYTTKSITASIPVYLPDSTQKSHLNAKTFQEITITPGQYYANLQDCIASRASILQEAILPNWSLISQTNQIAQKSPRTSLPSPPQPREIPQVPHFKLPEDFYSSCYLSSTSIHAIHNTNQLISFLTHLNAIPSLSMNSSRKERGYYDSINSTLKSPQISPSDLTRPITSQVIAQLESYWQVLEQTCVSERDTPIGCLHCAKFYHFYVLCKRHFEAHPNTPLSMSEKRDSRSYNQSNAHDMCNNYNPSNRAHNINTTANNLDSANDDEEPVGIDFLSQFVPKLLLIDSLPLVLSSLEDFAGNYDNEEENEDLWTGAESNNNNNNNNNNVKKNNPNSPSPSTSSTSTHSTSKPGSLYSNSNKGVKKTKEMKFVDSITATFAAISQLITSISTKHGINVVLVNHIVDAVPGAVGSQSSQSSGSKAEMLGAARPEDINVSSSSLFQTNDDEQHEPTNHALMEFGDFHHEVSTLTSLSATSGIDFTTNLSKPALSQQFNANSGNPFNRNSPHFLLLPSRKLPQHNTFFSRLPSYRVTIIRMPASSKSVINRAFGFHNPLDSFQAEHEDDNPFGQGDFGSSFDQLTSPSSDLNSGDFDSLGPASQSDLSDDYSDDYSVEDDDGNDDLATSNRNDPKIQPQSLSNPRLAKPHSMKNLLSVVRKAWVVEGESKEGNNQINHPQGRSYVISKVDVNDAAYKDEYGDGSDGDDAVGPKSSSGEDNAVETLASPIPTTTKSNSTTIRATGSAQLKVPSKPISSNTHVTNSNPPQPHQSHQSRGPIKASSIDCLNAQDQSNSPPLSALQAHLNNLAHHNYKPASLHNRFGPAIIKELFLSEYDQYLSTLPHHTRSTTARDFLSQCNPVFETIYQEFSLSLLSPLSSVVGGQASNNDQNPSKPMENSTNSSNPSSKRKATPAVTVFMHDEDRKSPDEDNYYVEKSNTSVQSFHRIKRRQFNPQLATLRSLNSSSRPSSNAVSNPDVLIQLDRTSPGPTQHPFITDSVNHLPLILQNHTLIAGHTKLTADRLHRKFLLSLFSLNHHPIFVSRAQQTRLLPLYTALHHFIHQCVRINLTTPISTPSFSNIETNSRSKHNIHSYTRPFRIQYLLGLGQPDQPTHHDHHHHHHPFQQPSTFPTVYSSHAALEHLIKVGVLPAAQSNEFKADNKADDLGLHHKSSSLPSLLSTYCLCSSSRQLRGTDQHYDSSDNQSPPASTNNPLFASLLMTPTRLTLLIKEEHKMFAGEDDIGAMDDEERSQKLFNLIHDKDSHSRSLLLNPAHIMHQILHLSSSSIRILTLHHPGVGNVSRCFIITSTQIFFLGLPFMVIPL